MGKAEKGTPKDIANRMKAKGLQKLRWYCQMCQKQCRDENGFKCHTTSESHQRQLLLFAENPDEYLDSFSQEFQEGYLSLLKRRFGTKRVHANNVYQEYIHDRHHVHMNATKWETLTDFVKWLGREGHCVVDETEKGWFVAYVDRDPETLLRQKKQQRRERHEKDEEERFQAFIQHQVEQGKAKKMLKEEESGNASPLELKRESEEAITLDLKLAAKEQCSKKMGFTNPLKAARASEDKGKRDSSSSAVKKRSVLEELIEEDKRRQKKFRDNDRANEKTGEGPWLTRGIVVKVITKELGSKFYRAKGIVMEVLDRYAAIVKLNESGTKLKLDQMHLETVIPNVGREVLLVAGPHKGQRATLKSIEVEKFSASLDLGGKRLSGIPYEHFSKFTHLQNPEKNS